MRKNSLYIAVLIISFFTKAFSQNIEYEKLSLDGIRLGFRKYNEILLIKNMKQLDTIVNKYSENKISCDFNAYYIVVCNIRDSKVLSCNENFELKLSNDTLKLINHHIGQDLAINSYTLMLKVRKNIKFNHSLVTFVRYGHGSKAWADSLCNVLKFKK